MPMIPDDELNTLLTRIDEAVALAAEGRLADGYSLLLAGMDEAKDAGEQGAGWADDLAERYRLALDNYAVSYGVQME
jgi:hypothetical protein